MPDLHKIAASMSAEDFEKQLGPFVLVQKPVDESTQKRALQLGAKQTVALKKASKIDKVSLLFELDNLLIATLPPMLHEGIVIGRLPDCELVIDDPSVSKHHAKLTWNTLDNVATLEDLNSSNGTQLNELDVKSTVVLRDGDEVTFGEARFCYLTTKVLHIRLTTGRFRK